ncbi:MAG: PAS domain S-box protein [Candidatus Doudnabacteria bacterium]|nr:PAS domain S-box protein [Candidatus Doudnabacteria bacterium]
MNLNEDLSLQFPHSHLDSNFWYEFRCKSCNKLLGKQHGENAKIEIKCLRCGTINSVLEDGGSQVFLTDCNGVILYINPQVEAVTGYTQNEVVGKTPAIWGRQMPEEFYKRLWKSILEEKKAVVFQVLNKKKNGELYDASIRISPILGDEGEVKYFLGIQTVIPKTNN